MLPNGSPVCSDTACIVRLLDLGFCKCSLRFVCFEPDLQILFLGIVRHTMLSYDELQNPQFVANDKTRCYHCRTELSGHLLTLASELGISTIVDGTNTDDLGDYRPGIEAMRKNGIHSPLVECEFSKRDVRREAKKLSMRQPLSGIAPSNVVASRTWRAPSRIFHHLFGKLYSNQALSSNLYSPRNA